MNNVSIGDLAQSFLLQRQNAQIKSDLNRLTNELASGRVSDVTEKLEGRFATFAGFERDLTLLQSYAATTQDAAVQAEIIQSVLDNVQSQTVELTNTLSLAYTAAGTNDLRSVGQEARLLLGSVVASLNTQVAGRALFSGTDVTTTPLPDVDTILTDFRLAVGGLTTSGDILLAADTFFDPGGGFETTLYQGGVNDLSEFDLGSGETVSFNLRADDTQFREVIKTLALAASIDDPALALPDNETRDLLLSLTERSVGSREAVTGLQASIGFAQERIETASVRVSSEISTIEIARNGLIGVDVFDTATELESVQVQLETLYTVTARSARLNLVNFL